MITLSPVTLEGHGIRLEPLMLHHGPALASAATDGRLWELWYTSVPEPDEVERYLAAALEGQAAGHMLPWVVRDLATNTIVGTTRESGGGRETEPGRASRATETALADG